MITRHPWLWLVCVGTALAAGNPVRLGSEMLEARGFKELRGKKVALLTNQTGVNRRGESTIDLLRRASGVDLVALFAPEHGLRGELKAGTEFPNHQDPRTKLPVLSLYGPGPTRQPTPKMLRGIDAVVYDLQDTGCRSYTYISTMGLAMEACGAAGVEFIVLDRPNPLGGVRIEGPMLEAKFRSFVGYWNIPYAYGMTCGELARMINGEGWIDSPCELTVISMSGWERSMVWKETGLSWVPTSPNVRSAETAMYLTATGVLGEIGGVSIGMGTDAPFQVVGAPWLDARQLAAHLAGYALPGVKFVPVRFVPTRGMFRKKVAYGVRIDFRDPATAPLVALNYYCLEAIRMVSKRDLFAEAVKRGQSFSMFDKVNGTDGTRKALQAGQSARRIVSFWRPGERAFGKRREKYLLY